MTTQAATLLVFAADALEGKTAIVAWATRGIGYGSRTLAEHGARVFVTG